MSDFRLEREMQEPTIAWLKSLGFICTRELCNLSNNPIDIVAARFEPRTSRRIPHLQESVAIELKLNKVGEVRQQATRNRDSVDRSFAALPRSRCDRLRPETLALFVEAGVGLLAVSPGGVVVLLPATPTEGTHDCIRRNIWRKCKREGTAPPNPCK